MGGLYGFIISEQPVNRGIESVSISILIMINMLQESQSYLSKLRQTAASRAPNDIEASVH